MYLQHFLLAKDPFSLTPDPYYLFLAEKHREALAALLFSVTYRKGLTVLTGPAGTGKTTLVRKLLASPTPSSREEFSVIVNPVLSRSEFLESVLMDFGQRTIPESKARMLSMLQTHLLRAFQESRACTLVVDEAHLLPPELLDEVRMLSNFETNEQKLLQIILVGQSELQEILSRPSMQQVRQRVSVNVEIGPLGATEVQRYVVTRWVRARTPRPFPFTDAAVELIARASGGIPRVINCLCGAALVNAYGAGLFTIGTAEVQEVMRDLRSSLPAGDSAAGLSEREGGTGRELIVSRVRGATNQIATRVTSGEHVAFPSKLPNLETIASTTVAPSVGSRSPGTIVEQPCAKRVWRFANLFRLTGGETK